MSRDENEDVLDDLENLAPIFESMEWHHLRVPPTKVVLYDTAASNSGLLGIILASRICLQRDYISKCGLWEVVGTAQLRVMKSRKQNRVEVKRREANRKENWG